MLLQRLNETADSELHALIIRQANEAASIAWLTSYPALIFPCLFEEKADAAVERARGEERNYCEDWRSASRQWPPKSMRGRDVYTKGKASG